MCELFGKLFVDLWILLKSPYENNSLNPLQFEYKSIYSAIRDWRAHKKGSACS